MRKMHAFVRHIKNITNAKEPWVRVDHLLKVWLIELYDVIFTTPFVLLASIQSIYMYLKQLIVI